jgi:cell division protein FtsQ
MRERSKRVSRKKKSPASRLRPFWFLIVLVVIVVGFGGYYAATWPGFQPKHVAIAGNRVVPSQEIAQRAHIASDANVWLQDTRAAQRRIEAIPYVKEAAIHRWLPANVRIAVTERVPYAILRAGSKKAVVDRDLRVLQRLDGPAPLPHFITTSGAMPPDGAFVNDPIVQRLRDDYEALSQAHVVVRSVSYDKFGDLIATMHNGVRLLLGDDADVQKKAALIGPILSQVAAGGRRIAAVDLRAVKTPVVVYR